MSSLQDSWLYKYKPNTINEMVMEQSQKDYFSDPSKLGDSFLLVGHSGIGKSTLAKLIVNEVLDCDYLYINASDENGIDTIRTKVSDFISTMSETQKVIILDEADGLSTQGQQALRAVMDEHDSVRGGFFILTANYGEKIIDAIKSRCPPYSINCNHTEYVKYIASILKREGVKLDKELLSYIKGMYPDFRKCIKTLQKNKDGDRIKIESKTISGGFIPELVNNIKQLSIYQLRKFIIENEHQFYSNYNLLCSMLFTHICEKDIDEMVKAQTMIHIGHCKDQIKTSDDPEITFFTKLIEIKLLWAK